MFQNLSKTNIFLGLTRLQCRAELAHETGIGLNGEMEKWKKAQKEQLRKVPGQETDVAGTELQSVGL